MKNKDIFLCDIVMLIISAMLIFTVTQKNRISSTTFDKLVISYGVINAFSIVYVLFKLIREHMNK